MIRRRLITLVALVAALAAGIALGGGPLSDVGRPAPRAEAAAPPPTDPLADDRAAFADAFAGDLGPGLYAGRLHAHPVVLLTLPGADPDTVAALTEQVQAAGTQVIASYGLKRTLVDPEEKTLVDTLGLQLVTQLGSDVVTADATTYDRMGQLVGRAVSATKRSAATRGREARLAAGQPPGRPPAGPPGRRAQRRAAGAGRHRQPGRAAGALRAGVRAGRRGEGGRGGRTDR